MQTPNETSNNRLIHGDNLIVLKALEKEYKGKIKCVYIDPPFNTGRIFDQYKDNTPDGKWLDEIETQLKIIHNLLSDKGVLWVHLNINKLHHVKLLLDKIFGEDNFINQITYERSGPSGLGQSACIMDTSEYLLFYKKEKLDINLVLNLKPIEFKTLKQYNKLFVSFGEKEIIREFKTKSGRQVRIFQHKNYKIELIPLRDFEKRKSEIYNLYNKNLNRIFRTTNIQKENSFQTEIISNFKQKCMYSMEYIPIRGRYKNKKTTLYYYNKEIVAWLKDSTEIIEGQLVKSNRLTTIWTNEEIPKFDLANEGGVKFKNGKKPENLIKRILEISTKENQLVLDSFSGSGTTGAVAHKMNRQWIMIEKEDQCITHIIPRLKNVISGDDQRGISKSINWKGGGNFTYEKLQTPYKS